MCLKERLKRSEEGSLHSSSAIERSRHFSCARIPMCTNYLEGTACYLQRISVNKIKSRGFKTEILYIVEGFMYMKLI